MKTTVTIEWDEPQEQAWLCADNIAVALCAYCTNTRFKVTDANNIEAELAGLRAENERLRVELHEAVEISKTKPPETLDKTDGVAKP